MRKIPLSPVPAQSLKVKLAGQNCQMRIYYRFGSTYLDLTVGGVVVCIGAICRDRQSIVQIANNAFAGNLRFVDMLGTSDPFYKNFGERFRLFYLTDEEIAERQIVAAEEPKILRNLPYQSDLLTYNGTAQSPTWNNYNPNVLTIGGVLSGTDAGTYDATFTPKGSYTWADGSIEAKVVSWFILKYPLDVPAQDGTLTYNGTTQTPTLDEHYNPSLMTISGDTSGINAGQYEITAALNDPLNYMWEDGETTDKTIIWSILRAVISSVPSQSGSLTYDGTEQSALWTGYDSTKMDIAGTTAGINAGNYTATFTPKSNYQWSDNTTAPKNVVWTIGKAAGSLSLSANSMSLDTDTTSGTVIITRAGDGAISAVSSDTSIATAAVSGTTLTITGVDTGSATVTVSVAEGANYLAPTDATVSVSVAFAPPVTNVLNDNSWDVISAIAQAGEGDLYWDIGDVKMITLNGKIGDYLTATNLSLGVFILGFNHVDNGVADNNIIFGGFKSALTNGVDVALVDSGYGNSKTYGKYFNMNHTGNYTGNNSCFGGWKGCDLRYDILGATSTAPSQYNQIKTTSNVGYDATESTLTNPVADTFLAALPSDMRAKLRLRTHYTDNNGASNVAANVTAVTDAVSLLAEKEIFGSRSNANKYEQNHQSQFAYYAAGNSKAKKKYSDNSAAVNWWECSPYWGDTRYFCGVNTSGNAYIYNASISSALAPVFKV